MKSILNIQNSINKLAYIALFLGGTLANAQQNINNPAPKEMVVAPPGGGVGAVGPGAPDTPIDMYVLILSGLAILMIFGYHFYTRRIKTQGI
ncbi:hypothetical protein ACXA18_02890 [Riemerella anatipestifer]|uniref:hypothetical protein n=1 Tax=Riemerella anatipestifer TaxID=34085 RepID=UPI0012B364EE|nr:hypothetical protein [Riemerella anatipestifer]MCO7354385.1 hypothetical protein [Riemerella anatipestifer]MSN86059.1 hypothetical protein [Riemerella anatipestifer]WFS33370.1 hypothetical protein D1Y77_002970 [Riemerella anatipestifer]